MSDIVVPPAPHWYKSLVFTCAPDGTLVYGSKNDIVIISSETPEKPAEVKAIHLAHRDYVISVSLNKKWKDPHCLCVSMGEDGFMKLWNLENLELKSKTKIFQDQKGPKVGAVFAGDDRFVGVSASGSVIVWNIHENEGKILNDLFKGKVVVTSVSSCPHAGWLLAFGLNSGAVVVADMRRNGQVLYKLRGHYHPVVGLTWCPVPINVFPKHPQNTVKVKTAENEEIKDKFNLWANVIEANGGEVLPEESALVKEKDFLKECFDLKDKILGVETSEDGSIENENEENAAEVTEDLGVQLNGQVNEEAAERKVQKTDENPDGYETDEKSAKDLEIVREDHENPQTSSVKESHSSDNELDSGNGRPLPVHFDPSGDFLDDFVPIGADEIAHQNEIQAESAAKTDSVEEEPRSEYLLASCARDGSVYIWRAGTDGRMQTFFNISKKGKKDKSKNPDPRTSWVSACWVSPCILLTSTFKGEVLAWPMPKPKDSSKLFKVVHKNHSSFVYNLASPPKLWTELNWREERDLKVWSWGHEGKLVRYDLGADKVTHSFTAVSAPITCFHATPVDPNRLAVGMRDGNIRIWDLSSLEANNIHLDKYYSKQTNKVCAMAWHPHREMILAFGTEEGRVGYIDISSKKTVLLSVYFNTQIHKIEWGPIYGDVKNLGLYVISESRMVFYDINHPTHNPAPVQTPKNVNIYRFAWKPDMSLMLMSGRDGSFFVINKKYFAFNTAFLGHKGSSEILWHPDAASSDADKSPRSNWFAVTTPDGLKVYDCVEDLDEKSSLLDREVAKFEGHLRPPVSLAWCPFHGDRIASTSTDGLTHVWDISKKGILSTFVDPYLSQNHAITWSPNDPDLILLGDKMLRFWSIKDHTPKVDKDFLSQRKQFIEAKVIREDIEKTPNLDNSRPKAVHISIVPAFYASSETNFPRQVDAMRTLRDAMESDSDNWEKDILDPLQIFGSERQVTQLLNAQYNNVKNDKNSSAATHLAFFNGNVGEYIQQALQEKRITQQIIALAPMVSIKLWQECCESYASQLSETANPDSLEISQFYLASHKIEDAAYALCRGLKFREALALVRRRLSGDCKLVTEVTERWASYCIETGNFETATLCYISLKKYEEAGKVLSRRSSRAFLKFALELVGDKNDALRDSIKFKLNELEETAAEPDDVSEMNSEDRIAVCSEICDAIIESVV